MHPDEEKTEAVNQKAALGATMCGSYGECPTPRTSQDMIRCHNSLYHQETCLEFCGIDCKELQVASSPPSKGSRAFAPWIGWEEGLVGGHGLLQLSEDTFSI